MTETTKKKPGVLTDAEKLEFAEKIMDYLAGKGMFFEVSIYTGAKRFSDSGKKGTAPCLTKAGTEYFAEDYDGCPCEYNNPDTLTMTFEGPLYHAMNEGGWDKPGEAWYDLNEIAEKYGLYHEMGYAWSLAFYA